MGTAKGDGYTVTPRDLELVVNAIGCTRLPFELDYEKLARRLGYKNAQSAKAAWNALKKKLDKVAEGAPVVSSLTIEPEPLRRTAGTPPRAESSGKKRGKQPDVEPPSETSEEEIGAESDEPPPRKPSKKRKQARVVDDDGDVSMAGTQKEPKAPKAKPGKSKSSSKRDKVDLGGQRRRHPAIPSSTPSATDSGTNTASEPEPKTPRKKLKRKLTHHSVSERPKANAKVKGQSSTGKSARELENEAFVAREKAFEAFGMRAAGGSKAGGGYDDEDEDDEEVDAPPPPPPPYFKREGE